MFGGGNQRLQAAPFGIGEITVVRSAAFHLDSVTGKSARAHLFKRALTIPSFDAPVPLHPFIEALSRRISRAAKRLH
jgi:hypothetical protein